MNNTTENCTKQQAKSSLYGIKGTVDIHDYRYYSSFQSYQSYKLSTSKNSKYFLDRQTLKRLGLERGQHGEIKALGSNANNVDDRSQVPAHSSPIGGFKSSSYKPVRELNHAIKKEISSNRLAYERVHDCGCKTIGKDAELYIDSRHNSARVSSVETCGSVWACPVCAQKVLKGRSEELQQIGDKWRNEGGKIYMLTFTFSHSRNDILSDLIGSSTEKTGLMGAIRSFRQSKPWRAFKEKFNYRADCRALEITWGNASGFHPHIHMLIYTKTAIPPYLQKMWETKLYKNWALQCENMDLGVPSRKHGVDLRPATEKDYIAKWGSSAELSSGYVKGGKNGNLTIRQLQEMLVDDLKRSIHGIALQKVKALLSVYNTTMKGNKLLTWGGQRKGEPSFKVQMLGEAEKTDQELAKIQEDEVQFLQKQLEIDTSSWMTIYWRGDSAKIRDVLEQKGPEAVIEWGIQNGYDCSTWSMCHEDQTDYSGLISKDYDYQKGLLEKRLVEMGAQKVASP
jgi:hypothetical protein